MIPVKQCNSGGGIASASPVSRRPASVEGVPGAVRALTRKTRRVRSLIDAQALRRGAGESGMAAKTPVPTQYEFPITEAFCGARSDSAIIGIGRKRKSCASQYGDRKTPGPPAAAYLRGPVRAARRPRGRPWGRRGCSHELFWIAVRGGPGPPGPCRAKPGFFLPLANRQPPRKQTNFL